jgi:ribA/ribD-fused uncharacterized protein
MADGSDRIRPGRRQYHLLLPRMPTEPTRPQSAKYIPWKKRQDWEEVKDSIMFNAVLNKFMTHQDIRDILLSTGQEEIIEDTVDDYYWGCGKNGTGKNMLGQILMQVREVLQR